MAKSVRTEAKEAANQGAKTVKEVAAMPLRLLLATAAAGVVLTRVAEGMGAGAKKVEQKKPTVQKAIGSGIKRGTKKKTSVKKASQTRGSKRKAARKVKSRKKR